MPDVLRAALQGTNQAYAEAARPTTDLTLPALSEHTMGQLMQMLMLATVVEGRLLGVNPYGQPGVEAYKKNMMRILKDTKPPTAWRRLTPHGSKAANPPTPTGSLRLAALGIAANCYMPTEPPRPMTNCRAHAAAPMNPASLPSAAYRTIVLAAGTGKASSLDVVLDPVQERLARRRSSRRRRRPCPGR